MDYGEVLTRAWQIISKHKILWLFGVMASCGSGQQAGSANFNIQSPQPTRPGEIPEIPTIPEEWYPLIIGGFCIILILVAVFFVLGVVGRVGLIKGTLQAEKGVDSLSFGQLFQDSQPYLGRALGLNLLVLIVALVLGGIVFVVVFGVTLFTFGLGLICLIPLICLLIPVGLFVRIVLEQANIALVVEDLGIGDAFMRGWTVARDNLGSMAIMGLILILGGGIVAFIISIPLIFIIFPAAYGLFYGIESSSQPLLLFAGICLIVYLPVLILTNGILQSFIKSAWTLTFLRLKADSPTGDLAEPLPAAT